MGFVFNRDYQDYEQVEAFLADFTRVYEEVKRPGGFAYNDSFKGRIPGIEGESEDTAIYLLQALRREREQQEWVAGLLADGYEPVEQLDETTRFARVVIYSATRRFAGERAEWTDARIVPQNGRPYGVLAKGKRTRGTQISGRAVLAKREAAR